MTLILNANGKITCPVSSSKKEMVLNNSDLENLLFSKFITKENFSISSLFNIFKNYPILLTLFPLMKDYLTEYESIENLDDDDQPSEFTIVMTQVCRLFHGLYSNDVVCETYTGNGVFKKDVNIGTMEVKDYYKFNIAINLLAVIESEIDETSELDFNYCDINPDETYNLLSFIKPLVDSITFCGTVRERNYLINELNKEKEELQIEVNEMSKDIMKKINLINQDK